MLKDSRLGEGIDAAKENSRVGSDRTWHGEIMMKDSSLAQIGSPLQKATRLPFEGCTCSHQAASGVTNPAPLPPGAPFGYVKQAPAVPDLAWRDVSATSTSSFKLRPT